MRTIITNLTNTYKAVRLLSDPTVGAYLQSQMKKSANPKTEPAGETRFGTKNAFYHKHYIVQIL